MHSLNLFSFPESPTWKSRAEGLDGRTVFGAIGTAGKAEFNEPFSIFAHSWRVESQTSAPHRIHPIE